MTIRTSNNERGEFLITLDETFDFNCVEDFRRAYEQFTPKPDENIVVDFRDARYIDSSALGMLINLQKHVQNSQCKIKLINPNNDIRKIFMISRFDKKFDIS
ncbi:STAS domain-containing protein [Aurantivibrio plasticivorans]